ncbi:MAG TPA: nucleotidyltransferase family protein [Edaphocola sp.]|nr:nucleotidyltransferase family protein [Edaphocola sp.]
MECIILAGGKGTRMKHILEDTPKCLAIVNGRPFIEYLMEYLERQYFDHIILSLGVGADQVLDWLKNKAFTFKISWVIEKKPLDTGGALKKAFLKCKEEDCFVINGDTLFNVPLNNMWKERTIAGKAIIALKQMKDFDRYGTVITDKNGVIIAFKEKEYCESGYINGGVYLFQNVFTIFNDFPEKFSLEKDFFEKEAGTGNLKSFLCDNYFIDIGIEEDYKRAQDEIGTFI